MAPHASLRFVATILLVADLTACNLSVGSGGEDEADVPTPASIVAAPPADAACPPAETVDGKWALWVDGPHLRGANIWQAIVIPELDGPDFKGPGPVGPPYSQEDFNRLAALGASGGIMDTGQDRSSSSLSPSSRKRLTWTQCTIIVLLTMSAGVVLNMWRPLLLAPPRLAATGLVYAALGLAWLGVLGVCALLRPRGNPRSAVLLLIVGLLATGMACFLLGPEIPGGGFLGSPLECRQVSDDNNRVRYECVADRMVLIDTYVLEGPEGWPFVWPVSKESTNL